MPSWPEGTIDRRTVNGRGHYYLIVEFDSSRRP